MCILSLSLEIKRKFVVISWFTFLITTADVTSSKLFLDGNEQKVSMGASTSIIYSQNRSLTEFDYQVLCYSLSNDSTHHLTENISGRAPCYAKWACITILMGGAVEDSRSIDSQTAARILGNAFIFFFVWCNQPQLLSTLSFRVSLTITFKRKWFKFSRDTQVAN